MTDRIQLRGDTAANWTAANPILAEREPGVVVDTGRQKIGDGVTHWNDLATFVSDGDFGAITMEAIADPTVPGAGKIVYYARSVSGRVMPKFIGPSGLSSPLQEALFQNSIWLVQPYTTTTISSIGGAITSVGTISHPTPASNTFGYCSNFLSAATVNSTAGTGHTYAPYNLATSVAANGGWFSTQRLFFPDANYGTGATGARFFVGATSNTMAAAVGADNPAGTRLGFSLSTNLGDTNFQFTSKDGTTESKTDTGMTFNPNILYDFYSFVPPDGSFCSWRIDDLVNGITREGIQTANLPPPAIYMRLGFQIATLTTVARNVRMKKIYVSTDN